MIAVVTSMYFSVVAAIVIVPGNVNLQMLVATPVFLFLVAAATLLVTRYFGVENRHRPRQFRRKVILGALGLNTLILAYTIALVSLTELPPLQIIASAFAAEILGHYLLLKYVWQHRHKNYVISTARKEQRPTGQQRPA